ncbi:MAG: hypothetical protein IJ685_13510 [Selenomonadaceae bacterium]|nr:hypothetical protein [Selenomonadaceae bacterium]
MTQCGLENFTIEVIETQTQANDRERFWIKVLDCKAPKGYNQRGGGCGIRKPKANNMCGIEESCIGKTLRERRPELSLTQRHYKKKQPKFLSKICRQCSFADKPQTIHQIKP